MNSHEFTRTDNPPSTLNASKGQTVSREFHFPTGRQPGTSHEAALALPLIAQPLSFNETHRTEVFICEHIYNAIMFTIFYLLSTRNHPAERCDNARTEGYAMETT